MAIETQDIDSDDHLSAELGRPPASAKPVSHEAADSKYLDLIGRYEENISEHGPTLRGVWLDQKDGGDRLTRRMETMLGPATASARIDLLDLGCGPGLTLDYLQAQDRLETLAYRGVDISPLMIDHARRRWPNGSFELRDIIRQPLTRASDFTIVNGILTYRATLGREDMEHFAHRLLKSAWSATTVCLSFNVMSTHLDYERDDLFHWPMDSAMRFCRENLSRHVVMMADYGLYEYTVHVFRSERQAKTRTPSAWAHDGSWAPAAALTAERSPALSPS